MEYGLKITKENDLSWEQVNEPTSPHGQIWRLNYVHWLAVKATVRASHPGLYAAFFRIRRRLIASPLLDFFAEWKADAANTRKPGFLEAKRLGRNGCYANTPYLDVKQGPVSRQYSEAVVSWFH